MPTKGQELFSLKDEFSAYWAYCEGAKISSPYAIPITPVLGLWTPKPNPATTWELWAFLIRDSDAGGEVRAELQATIWGCYVQNGIPRLVELNPLLTQLSLNATHSRPESLHSTFLNKSAASMRFVVCHTRRTSRSPSCRASSPVGRGWRWPGKPECTSHGPPYREDLKSQRRCMVGESTAWHAVLKQNMHGGSAELGRFISTSQQTEILRPPVPTVLNPHSNCFTLVHS